APQVRTHVCGVERSELEGGAGLERGARLEPEVEVGLAPELGLKLERGVAVLLVTGFLLQVGAWGQCGCGACPSREAAPSGRGGGSVLRPGVNASGAARCGGNQRKRLSPSSTIVIPVRNWSRSRCSLIWSAMACMNGYSSGLRSLHAAEASPR